MKQVKEGRLVLDLLLAELKAEAVHIGFLDEIVEEEAAGNKSPKRRMAIEKALSLPVRMQAAKTYALALATLTSAGPGKKEQAQDAAQTAGRGTDWNDDLNAGGFGAN